MKANTFYLVLLLFVINPCKSQNVETKQGFEPEEYILLNENFINTVKDKIFESQIKVLSEEKEVFLQHNIIDSIYLKILNKGIKKPFTSYNTSFFDIRLKNLINDRFKNVKVKNVYFLNLQLHSGGMIVKYNFVIIEGLNYTIDLYTLSNINTDIKHTTLSHSYDIELIHEYMINAPYSFNYKSLFNNNTQYFTWDKISSTGKNAFTVESIVISNMLDSQKKILSYFFDF